MSVALLLSRMAVLQHQGAQVYSLVNLAGWLTSFWLVNQLLLRGLDKHC